MTFLCVEEEYFIILDQAQWSFTYLDFVRVKDLIITKE